MIEAIAGLTKRGIEVIVLLPEDGDVAKPWSDLGVRIERVPAGRWALPKGSRFLRGRLGAVKKIAAGIRRIRQLLELIQPDLVVTNTIVVPAAAFAARAVGLPHVWYVHEFGDRDHGYSFILGRSWTAKIVNFLSAAMVVNSRAVRDHFARWFTSAKTHLVHYSVEPVSVWPVVEAPRSGRPRLVIVGALMSGKRQEDAIRATSILHRRGIDVELIVVGSGDPGYAQNLRNLCECLDLDEHVRFRGQTETPLNEFARADVGLMCSREEAFGRVTIEAMKVGIPVIGAQSGGTSELIEDGFNGYLYQPQHPEHLADVIERAIRDRRRLRVMGSRAQEWAFDNFNEAKFTEALIAVFKCALGGEGRNSIKTSDHCLIWRDADLRETL